MFKLLGFTLGCAASLGALLLLVGTPEFHFAGRDTDDSRYDAAIEKLRQKRQHSPDVPALVETTADNDSAVAASQDSSVALRDDVVLETPPSDLRGETPVVDTGFQSDAERVPIDPAPAVATDDQSIDEHSSVADTRADEMLDEDPDDSLAKPGWHTIWNPFRSEIAARGFVRRLETVTGIDYRVTKVQNGVYQVAFPYQSDLERATKLAQIAAATGLDLADNRP